MLINPFNGIVVFEIKNLNLRKSNFPQKEINNLIDKVEQNRDEIYEIYCPRLINKTPIISGLIITGLDSDSVQETLECVEKKIENRYSIISAHDLTSKDDLLRIFSKWKTMYSRNEINNILNDFRAWIRESTYAKEAKHPTNTQLLSKKYSC